MYAWLLGIYYTAGNNCELLTSNFLLLLRDWCIHILTWCRFKFEIAYSKQDHDMCWSLSVTERMLSSHQGCHANIGTSQSGSCKQVHFAFILTWYIPIEKSLLHSLRASSIVHECSCMACSCLLTFIKKGNNNYYGLHAK